MLERMHAVVQQAFGGPEVLEVAEIDRPVPLATEVLVRVEAVGVNPVEPLIRSGQFPLIGPPPFILGWDISGVIEHLEGVTRFDVGDQVPPSAWSWPGSAARICLTAVGQDEPRSRAPYRFCHQVLWPSCAFISRITARSDDRDTPVSDETIAHTVPPRGGGPQHPRTTSATSLEPPSPPSSSTAATTSSYRRSTPTTSTSTSPTPS